MRLKELSKRRSLPEREELEKKLSLTHCALTERQAEVDVSESFGHGSSD